MKLSSFEIWIHEWVGWVVQKDIQGETELSFRLIPSLTQSHTKPRTNTVRDEVILAKEGVSLKDNSVSYCIYYIIKLLICNILTVLNDIKIKCKQNEY